MAIGDDDDRVGRRPSSFWPSDDTVVTVRFLPQMWHVAKVASVFCWTQCAADDALTRVGPRWRGERICPSAGTLQQSGSGEGE